MEALIARSVQILIALGGAYLLTLWFAIVVWTFQDIQARSRSVVAQIFSTLVVLIFSIPGLLVYMILRPRYTLDDAFQRSLEEEYLMQDLEELPLCPNCQQYVEDDWVFCPNCRVELRDNCIACDQLIDLRWEICPFCGTEQYEDEDALPAPVLRPVMSPSPQYLGRPQLNQTEVFQLQFAEQRTRPIIPATVRVDLRSGDIATEEVPEPPVASPLRPVGGLSAPRRVALDGNGANGMAIGPDNETQPDYGYDDDGRNADLHNRAAEKPATEESAVSEPQPEPAATETSAVDDESDAPESDGQAPSSQTGSSKDRSKRQRKRRSRRKRSRSAGVGEGPDAG